MGIAVLIAVGAPLALTLKFGAESSALVWVSLGWMVLYSPVALLVAGVSDRFITTVNPLVGVAIAIRMGGVFWKMMTAYLLVSMVAAAHVWAVIVTVAPAGFNLIIYLTFGLAIGPPDFYANMVIACLIGRALFKCAGRPTV